MFLSGFYHKLAFKVGAVVNGVLNIFSLRLSRNQPLVYLHQYKSYEEYAETQKFHNRRKLENVWADDLTLALVARLIQENASSSDEGRPIRGLCHGARNGYEVKSLRNLLQTDRIIGTDISETAELFNDIYVWDFHDERQDWISQFDFIYTNSLDQSWRPFDALSCWLSQINSNGLIIIEHTKAHGVESAGAMDPFGVLPEFFPYVICQHFGKAISLEIHKSTKSNFQTDAWLFVIRKSLLSLP